MSRRNNKKSNGNSKSPRVNSNSDEKPRFKEETSVYSEDAYSSDDDYNEDDDFSETADVKSAKPEINSVKSEVEIKSAKPEVEIKSAKSAKPETNSVKSEAEITGQVIGNDGIETVKKKAVRKKAVAKTAAKKHEEKDSVNPDNKKKKKMEMSEPDDNEDTEGVIHALIRKMIFCLSLGVFCYALSGLLVLMWGYYSSQQEYEKLNEDLVVIGSTEDRENNHQDGDDTTIEIPGESNEKNNIPFIDIKIDEVKWKAINDDYSFYLYIPGTKIQYPVVQGEDNNHYLRYTYENKENTAGAIAIDYRTDRDAYFEKFNMIISGHNRQDGTMFSDLANYKDESFRNKNPYIYIVYNGKEYIFEIFAFYAMKPVALCYNPNASSDAYLAFINENNTYTMENDVTTDDIIITLYTCNEDSSMRYLCHAVLKQIYDIN